MRARKCPVAQLDLLLAFKYPPAQVKTIATFSKPEEAHLFRMRLGAAGIAAFVQDEHVVQMDWLYSNAVGGVRVQIRQ